MDSKLLAVIFLTVALGGAYFVKTSKEKLPPPSAQAALPKPESEQAPVTPPAVPVPVAPTTPPVEPPSQPPAPSTAASYPEALKAAAASGKPVFLYFGAEWCGPCQAMKASTLADPAVRSKLGADFITCVLDIDRERAAASQFRVASVPTYMVVSKDGQIVKRASGGRGRDEFLAWLGR